MLLLFWSPNERGDEMISTKEEIMDAILKLIMLPPNDNCEICDLALEHNKLGITMVLLMISNNKIPDVAQMFLHLLIDMYIIGVEDGLKKYQERKDVEELARMLGEKL
jgi:CheY-like chemotaxis protein